MTIVFAGGCFWCVEAVFQMLRGVEKVESGYAGAPHQPVPGKVASFPTYEQVSSGTTGHAEVVRVEYDPNIVTLEDLLAVFFSSHDPTTRNRQGADVGSQYRSAIFYTTPLQKTAAEAYMKKLEDEKTFSSPIVTELAPLEAFYPAEEYHKDYYRKNQENPYCQAVIDPKIAKLRQSYAHLLTS